MSKQSDRTARLAQALRANLRRRKAGGRAASGGAAAQTEPLSATAEGLSRASGTPSGEDATDEPDGSDPSPPKKP